MTAQTPTLEALQAEYPGWRIWPSDRGELVVATRLHQNAGVSATVVRNSLEDLRDALEGEREKVARLGRPYDVTVDAIEPDEQ